MDDFYSVSQTSLCMRRMRRILENLNEIRACLSTEINDEFFSIREKLDHLLSIYIVKEIKCTTKTVQCNHYKIKIR